MLFHTQADSGIQRQRARNFAKVSLVLAFACNANAFQPLGLRPITPACNNVGRLCQQAPMVGLRQRTNKPLILATLASPVVENDCSVLMKDTAKKNFQAWNECLKAQDFQKATSLYSAVDLSFLPTLSPDFIRDSPSAKRYFADFVQKLPSGEITDDLVQVIDDNTYLHSGMYTFMTGEKGARLPVRARFTYMWRRAGDNWKIIHHHSSEVPGYQEDHFPVARENFDRWNNALLAKDYEKVASLYSKSDLSFLPTVSPKFIRDPSATQDYFMEFLKKLPEGTIENDTVQSFGNDAYLHTGLYTFMVGPANDRKPVEARFSYMWRKLDGSWKITHHHSSALPKVPGAEEEEIASEEMYPIAQENFERWNNALQARDFVQVAKLYSSSVSFLPTVSPKFIRDAPSTRDYFMEFLKKLPDGKITADDVKVFGRDAYLHSGMYTFTVGAEDDRQSVDARFSYMWRRIAGEWKITHHHSSALPKVASAPEPQLTAEDFYPLAQENFEKWNNALKEKKFEKVAALYSSKDLSFLPTVSPKFIQDPQSTQQYFQEFLKKFPEGTITADRVQNYGNDAYLHSGMYTFMVGPESDRTPVEARFSYMWRKINGNWKITHHHSSALPGVPARPAKVINSENFYPIAQANFNRWNEALLSRDYEKVAALYSSTDLSFLPTVSPDFIRDTQATKQYFIAFLQKLPYGTITSDNVQNFGDDMYLHSGMYTFLTGPENNRTPVNARFSYMWRKVEGDWKITHHHSSAVPGVPGKPVEKPQSGEAVDFKLAPPRGVAQQAPPPPARGGAAEEELSITLPTKERPMSPMRARRAAAAAAAPKLVEDDEAEKTEPKQERELVGSFLLG